jgi:hypothetical protein|tara:strand:+ start:1494 stop:1805 length:312 start_codon:yes stop_codon:yes gene_type:complete
MKIKLKLDTTLKYLQFWNSMFNLTPKELKVLVEFIDISTYDVICTKSDKKAVAMVLGFSDPNTLNNYIKKFKDKKAIELIDGTYRIHKLLGSRAGISIEILPR